MPARASTGRHRPLGSEVQLQPAAGHARDPPARHLPGPGPYPPVAEARPRSPPVPRPPQGAPPASSCGPGPGPRPRRGERPFHLRPGSRRCRLQSLPPPPRCSPTAPGERATPAHSHARAPGATSRPRGMRPRYGRWDSALTTRLPEPLPRKLISAKARPAPRLSLNAHRRVTCAKAKREPQAPSSGARHSWLLWSSELFPVKQVDSSATSCWFQLLVHLNDRPCFCT